MTAVIIRDHIYIKFKKNLTLQTCKCLAYHVNLFVNEFHRDILIGEDETVKEDKVPHYTPNGSLQGSLEKSWTILDGKRGMIKGNRDQFSTESINEVIASKLYELQGFDAYAEYKLIKIHGREYDYGCYSKLFTS